MDRSRHEHRGGERGLPVVRVNDLRPERIDRSQADVRADPRQRRLFGAEAGRRPFWQARFYDFNVWTAKKRVEKLRYMHRNPVKRGLVSSPEQWPWSSYRFYLFDEAVPVRVNEGWTKISFRASAA